MARMGDRTGVYRILFGRPEGKIPLGRLSPRWEDNIKCTFYKWIVGVDWIACVQYMGQAAETCECGNEHSCGIKCEEFLD